MFKPRPKPRQPGRSEVGRKKIIIAGSRGFSDYRLLFETMEKLTAKLDDPILLSGGARGADKLGIQWAEFNWYLIKLYLPDYDKYGKGAPLVRNEEMAKDGDYLAAFWDGESHGTGHMIRMAEKYGVKTKIIEVI